MARRTKTRRQQPDVQALRRIPAAATVEPQPLSLALPLLAPPAAAPCRRVEAEAERLPGSSVIVIDLN
jgi:hypothetical protein